MATIPGVAMTSLSERFISCWTMSRVRRLGQHQAAADGSWYGRTEGRHEIGEPGREAIGKQGPDLWLRHDRPVVAAKAWLSTSVDTDQTPTFATRASTRKQSNAMAMSSERTRPIS